VHTPQDRKERQTLCNYTFVETGLQIDLDQIERLRRLHASMHNRRANDIRPLSGAREILSYLSDIEFLGERVKRMNGDGERLWKR
jgi:hypothetical protein